MFMAIIYLVYLFFKILAIIIPLLCGPQINIKNDDIIKNILLKKEDNTTYKSNEQFSKSTDELKGNSNIEEEKLDSDEKEKNSQTSSQNENKDNYVINVNNNQNENKNNYENYHNSGFNESNKINEYNENNNKEEFVIEQNEELNKESN